MTYAQRIDTFFLIALNVPSRTVCVKSVGSLVSTENQKTENTLVICGHSQLHYFIA